MHTTYNLHSPYTTCSISDPEKGNRFVGIRWIHDAGVGRKCARVGEPFCCRHSRTKHARRPKAAETRHYKSTNHPRLGAQGEGVYREWWVGWEWRLGGSSDVDLRISDVSKISVGALMHKCCLAFVAQEDRVSFRILRTIIQVLDRRNKHFISAPFTHSSDWLYGGAELSLRTLLAFPFTIFLK